MSFGFNENVLRSSLPVIPLIYVNGNKVQVDAASSSIAWTQARLALLDIRACCLLSMGIPTLFKQSAVAAIAICAFRLDSPYTRGTQLLSADPRHFLMALLAVSNTIANDLIIKLMHLPPHLP